jgi:hypothetical protein
MYVKYIFTLLSSYPYKVKLLYPKIKREENIVKDRMYYRRRNISLQMRLLYFSIFLYAD